MKKIKEKCHFVEGKGKDGQRMVNNIKAMRNQGILFSSG